jgi:curved DNA-binding protein CbpA
LRTHYELLGLEPSASADDIKHAFRREIARYHPDKVQHLGHEFQEIAATRAAELTEAYRILMDPASREKYDSHIGTGTAPVAGAAPAAAARPEPSTEPEAHNAEPPIPEAFKQTRATISEFVRKATLARVTDAAQAVCEATPISVRGFDAAYLCRAKRGLFKKAEPALSLVMRLVPAVDPSAIEDAWPFALKAGAGDATLCMMLIGQGLAPARELAAAVAEQRRRSRNPGPIVVPVDFRDWEALFPPETPSSVRALVERLRQADR